MDLINKLDKCIVQLHELISTFEDLKESLIRENEIRENETCTDEPETIALTEEPVAIVMEEEIRSEAVEEAMPAAEAEAEFSLPATESVENRIIKTIYSDFSKALSLNDRFRFQRDLFANDPELMKLTLEHICTLDDYTAMTRFLREEFNWDWDSDSVKALDDLLKMRFS